MHDHVARWGQEAQQDRQEGRVAGESWAKSAKLKQVRRLDRLASEEGTEGALDVLGDIVGDGGDERIEESDFAQGFIEGALQVYDEAQPGLRRKATA